MPPKNRNKGNVTINSAARRKSPPGFANSFALSSLHNEVVVIDFSDTEEGLENIFSSVALTKYAAQNLSQHLADLIDSLDATEEEHEAEHEE